MAGETVLSVLGRSVGNIFQFLPARVYDFLENYFRLEFDGLEHVPEDGRGILVANHSDAFGYDAFILAYLLAKEKKRKPHMMAHLFWFSNDFLASMSRTFDIFPADLRAGLKTLANDNLIVIFPEGADGNFKVSSNMYNLVEFNPGFVPLAIMQRAPVIPTVIMGAEETHFNLAKISAFREVLGADIPLPLNVVPFPAKWKIRFLPPIDFGKYNKRDIKDARFVKEINQNIRYRIQHEIDRELAETASTFFLRRDQ